MKILSSSMCKIGGRDYNQDYVASSIKDSSACFVVCDGLGSYVGSEVASRLCATKIIEEFESIRDLDVERACKSEYTESYIHNAHNYVSTYKETNPQISSSCTTVSCVTTDGVTSSLAHIGDTRIYYFKNNKLTYQSKDHSISQTAVEQGLISLRDIRTHKDQNKLTRVLGSDYYIPPDVEIIKTPLEVGDAFLLCTDGFWEYIFEEEMESDLEKSSNPGEVLTKLEARLLKRIGKYNDNYSAIVAMVVKK